MLLLCCLGATGQANYDLTKIATERLDRGVIATRIKIELKHTDKSVAQISEDMNFPNPSFFSKYFKRLTGLTPLEYREG